MTFYLKYRPQTIEELDLASARQSLGEILTAKEIPHAFLFTGPKGTGKTSSARILAKAVNCLKPKKGEPCNECVNCKLITSARSMDIIEIDAASNRGIDDIRDLRDKIKLAAASLKFKVYIIDEVHMLTNEAFNALLKTLEEPPKHVKLVLCTTEPQKLPGTIISRCFQVKFTKANQAEVVRSLQRVVDGEKLKLSEEDLKKIAQAGGGSFRDAVKILEQLAGKNENISSERVSEVLDRGTSSDDLSKWLELIYNGEVEKALLWLNLSLNEGAEVMGLILKAVEKLRQIFLQQLGIGEAGEETVKFPDQIRLKLVLGKLMQAGREVKGAVVESLPLELAISELGINNKEPAKDERSRSGGKVDLPQVMEKWPEILTALRPHNHSLEALLKATRPAGFEDQYLMVEVFYKFHKERLEEERYRKLIEEVASLVLAGPIKIKYYLGNLERR
ncbi:MAG: DNA polymerase III subunit gamma/tau [Patescibacteria group bacterium]